MRGIEAGMYLVFAIVCTAIVLVLGMLLLPTLRYSPFSPCWGSYVSNTDEINSYLEGKLSSFRLGNMYEHEMKIGDCVSEFQFINAETLKKSRLSEFCPKDAQAYMIGMPMIKELESEWTLRFWTTKFYTQVPENIWLKVKKVWQEDLGGVKPVCYPLSKPFNKEICKTSARKSCEANLTFNIGDTYDLKFEGTCEDCEV